VLVSALSAVEEKLNDPDFIRVHRKYAVHIRRVTAVEAGQVRIGDIVIPVGRTHRDTLMARLDRSRSA
jgi:DNA-binding LytR/AlgR family response regulator